MVVVGIRGSSALVGRRGGRQLTLLHFVGRPGNVRRYEFGGVEVVVRLPRRHSPAAYPLTSPIFGLVSSFDRAYLLGSYYDGRAAKAVLKFFEPSSGRVLLWYDNTGHLPYFLVDVRPEVIRERPEYKAVVDDKSLERLEVVEKYDLLTGRKVSLTKIVVKDPLAVVRLRKVFTRVWEANIKYHDNYLFDNALVPGMIYRSNGKGLEMVRVPIPDEIRAMYRRAFEGEPESVRASAERMTPFFETEPPAPHRLAIDIEVYTPFRGRIPDPEYAAYPIISVALTATDGLRKVLVLRRPDVGFGDLAELPEGYEVEVFDSEYGLLRELFRIVSGYPIILTFNGDDFDIPYIINRALKLGIRPDEIPFHVVRDFFGVRNGFHIDLYRFFSIEAIQNYAFGQAYKEKTLDAIAQALLGEAKVRIDESISDLPISLLVKYNAKDSELTLRLTTFDGDLVWKLIVLIMRLAKMSLEDVTRRKVSAWIKNLMYWEHRVRGYLIPNKDDLMKLKGQAKTAAKVGGKRYAGAIVINPVPGVYFDVVVVDFASLYPSIIKVWNLSYETVDPPRGWCGGKEAEVRDEKGQPLHRVCLARRGITSEIVGLLRDMRVKIYKKMAKRKDLPEILRSWYDVVQAAMKVYINASYGVFGHDKFPFYTPSLAESVTALGRHVITSTLRKASSLGLKVLYGDTDSLFLWHPDRGKLEELIEWVEREFQLDLELDKVYKFVAFALKKNYIGVRDSGKIDIKGLMGKKKNVPKAIQEVFAKVVETIASIEASIESLDNVKRGLRDTIHGLYTRMKEKRFSLDEVAYRTTLNKPLSAYTKTTPIHVKAAKLLQRNGIQVAKGDVIYYVKTRSRDKVKPIQLAKLDDVDINSYIDDAKSVLQQLLLPFNMQWDEVVGRGVNGLVGFFGR